MSSCTTTAHQPPIDDPSSSSAPESLDLDYDDWEGQFEFVGPANHPANSAATNRTSNRRKDSDSGDDLNLSLYVPNTNGHQPVLFDEETFLSLNPNDFDDCGPPSELFIEDCATLLKKCNLDALHNQNGVIGGRKFVSAKFHAEELNNIKNRLLSDEIVSMKGQKPNQNNNNNNITQINNELAADLCDNLTEQLEILQRQVTNLADSQNTVDDRTSRTKTEHAVLQARYDMLEEQLRDSELRAEERFAEEQKRHRDLLARVEREAALQNENSHIKVRTIEQEATALRDEVQRLRVLCDKQAADLHVTEEKLEVTRDNYQHMEEELAEAQLREKRFEAERAASEELMMELGREVERLRAEKGPAMPTTSPEAIRLEELHQEMQDLRDQKKVLEEQNEELQAIVLNRGIEEGRNLLNCTSNSLAQELGQMDQIQDSVDSAAMASLTQVQTMYQEKEEENLRLKTYIDTILLNIVENYPQLLEVKNLGGK